MDFLKKINNIHWIFLSLFLVLYLLLITKTIWSCIRLKSSYRHIFIKLALRSTYFGLIIVATLGPTFGGEKKQIKHSSKDVYFAIDISNSMNCKDITPSRLERCKIESIEIAKSLANDKVGLIAFGSSAQIYCPLTNDLVALNTFVNTINTSNSHNGTTDLSSPIELILQNKDAEQEKNTKVLVILSDGEDFSNKYQNILNDANKENFHIVGIGIGTNIGAKIPSVPNFLKDKSGAFVISKLNKESLLDICNQTNGKYFELSENKNEIKQAQQFIFDIEGVNQKNEMIKHKENKYFYFLIIAFVLILFDILFNVKIIRL